MNESRNPDRTDFFILGLISGCGLTFEILLLRVFSYSQWHHFASIAISLALLGFGIAGTCLTLLNRRDWHPGDRFHATGMLIAACGMLLAYALPHVIMTRPLFAVWDTGELIKLLILDFVCLIPFFGIALSIGQVFIRWPAYTSKLYCTNLIGSGMGALLPVVLLPFVFLESALLVVPMLLLLGVAVYSMRSAGIRTIGNISLLGSIIIGAWIFWGPPRLPVSDFKQLSYFLDFPDAEIVDRQPGLSEETTIIQSDAIRMAPGLSLKWANAVPSQDVAVMGSDMAIPLPRKDADSIFNSARLGQLPIILRPDGKIAVTGMSDWLSPEQVEDQSVIWIQDDSRLFELYQEYGLLDNIETTTQSFRSFLSRTGEYYSLIYLNGAYATRDSASVDYTLTKEGIQSALDRLDEHGILAIPVHFEYPPRYSAKLVKMLNSALQERGIGDPAQCMAILRSMQDALFLVVPDSLRISDISLIRSFSSEWNFDLCVLPGLGEDEVNQFNILDEPVLFNTMKSLRDGQYDMPAPAAWFSLKEPTDSNPHFWRTVEWGKAFSFFKSIGRQSLVWMDWAILALVVKLLISAVLAALLIILPLGMLPSQRTSRSRFSVFLYFASLGLGFLLLEIIVFQRCLMYIPQEVVAASVVFTVFLIGAGTGSLSTPDFNHPHPGKSIFIPILLAIALAYTVLYQGKPILLGIHPSLLLVLIICALFPLAWSMGRAFPWGLRQLDRQREWIPWAWGINGFFSVIAAPSATLLSIHFNQSVTWIGACACYVLAALTASTWIARST